MDSSNMHIAFPMFYYTCRAFRHTFISDGSEHKSCKDISGTEAD